LSRSSAAHPPVAEAERQRRLDAYLARGLHQVEGWLDPFSARAVATIGLEQRRLGLAGAVGEIGVHHGRLFILLYLLSTPSERAFAVDVFGDQAQNVDGSGRGSESTFIRNLLRHAGGRERVEIFACDSNALSASEIETRVGRCRLISVDGGHTAETTENDLRLADALLVEGGVCILDDYFNPMWPDVSSGAARYLLSPGCRLHPFLITPNKLFLQAGKAHAETYVAAVASAFPWRRSGENRMFGCKVAIFGIDPPDLAGRLQLRLAQGPLRPLLRPLYHRLRRLVRRDDV
jgi:hypothetical protein